MSNTDFENISFDLPKNQSNVIKVIGVGGGGSNAINHMFSQGIKGVDFVVCNTDAQALENSPVPIRIQLGVSLTEGLGAGANPEVGEQAAIESLEEVKQMLGTNTKMIFITAGMGGGTGTGAAPVIAKMAKEMDVLTVGIVTIPFQFEGKMRNEQAQLGVEKLRSHVDSLIVINNNKLREVYGNLGGSGFPDLRGSKQPGSVTAADTNAGEGRAFDKAEEQNTHFYESLKRITPDRRFFNNSALQTLGVGEKMLLGELE